MGKRRATKVQYIYNKSYTNYGMSRHYHYFYKTSTYRRCLLVNNCWTNCDKISFKLILQTVFPAFLGLPVPLIQSYNTQRNSNRSWNTLSTLYIRPRIFDAYILCGILNYQRVSAINCVRLITLAKYRGSLMNIVSEYFRIFSGRLPHWCTLKLYCCRAIPDCGTEYK